MHFFMAPQDFFKVHHLSGVWIPSILTIVVRFGLTLS
jgi:hypothetical protein